jgi:hypothetical protein
MEGETMNPVTLAHLTRAAQGPDAYAVSIAPGDLRDLLGAYRAGGEAMKRAALKAVDKSKFCPFDNPAFELSVTTPCPVCGDLGDPSDAPSNCKSPVGAIAALPVPEAPKT